VVKPVHLVKGLAGCLVPLPMMAALVVKQVPLGLELADLVMAL
jgi:hypothetical protein